MKEKSDNMLKELYEFQVLNGKNGAQINRNYNDDNNWREQLNVVQYLEEKGYIEKVAHAMGFIIIRLTAFGIDYVEENLL